MISATSTLQSQSVNTEIMPMCYHGGAFFDAIGDSFAHLDRRHSVINADVLDAWFPPAPGVVRALQEHLPWLIQTSPPTHCSGLIDTIARVRGVPRACILPGAGSSDLIFLALRNWLDRGSRVLLLDPTYGEYVHICERIIGCTVERLPLHLSHEFEVDCEILESTFKDDFDLVVLVNPNNPTGKLIPRDRLEQLLRRLPVQSKCWVDEAYIEYAGMQNSTEQFAARSANVIVSKSLSKAYALSGIRAAYLIANEDIIKGLLPFTPPWSVSLPGQVAAVRALSEPTYYSAQYHQTTALRDSLAAHLEDLLPNANVIRGVANFVFCQLDSSGPTAAEIVRRCRDRNLFVRDVGGMGTTLGSHALRIAVKDPDTQSRMISILEGALRCDR